MTKIGIELGIRAPFDAILKASKIADEHSVDYFLVPETHPESLGVDAFETILQIVGNIKNVTVGTGIVNVFSREKEETPSPILLVPHQIAVDLVRGGQFFFLKSVKFMP